MMSFQSLHLRSTRLPPPYNKWIAKESECDDDDESVYVRTWFGQRVLWSRFSPTPTNEENERHNDHHEDHNNNNNGKNSSRNQQQQPQSHPVGRHLTCQELEPYRLIGDPLVDDLLQALQDAGSPVQAGDDLLRYCQEQANAATAITTTEDCAKTQSHDSATLTIRAQRLAATFWNTYYNPNDEIDDPSSSSSSSALLPSWVNVEQLQRGQQVFLAYTPAMSYALYYRSFVPGFSIPKIAQVLRTTGYLTPRNNTKKTTSHVSPSDGRVPERLVDTGAFVAACMGLNVSELLPGQVAWRTILQVRILHAKVRHALRKRKDWKVEEWGVPINAEDMAATLLAFSTNAMLGVEFLLGFPLSRREREDFLALWRYIGWLLGVDVLSTTKVSTATGKDANEVEPDSTIATMVNSIPNRESMLAIKAENISKNGNHQTTKASTHPLRPLDPCGPGWIADQPDSIEHSNSILQSIIFHILHPDKLSVTISHHLLRMKQQNKDPHQLSSDHQQQGKQHQQGQSHNKSNGHLNENESSAIPNYDNTNSLSSPDQAQRTKEDNLWFYYRALQCRRFIGDPLADALQLPLHGSWWKRQWLYFASTCCLLLVRWYTRLALPWSPLRGYMIRYHQNGLQQFWNSWLEAHPRRMAKALVTPKITSQKLQQPMEVRKVDDDEMKKDENHVFACPFAMVAPPIY
jgi:hypothetical protein